MSGVMTPSTDTAAVLKPTPKMSMKLSAPAAFQTNASVHEFPFVVVSRLREEYVSLTTDISWAGVSKQGTLVKMSGENRFFNISWGNEYSLHSPLSARGRGMMLSELIAYCGKLYASDQSTGVLFELSSGELYPRQIVMGGDGLNTEALRSEWAAVRHGLLYIGTGGSLSPSPYTGGKSERSLRGQRTPSRAMSQLLVEHWVVTIDPSGRVNHLDWEREFTSLEIAAEVDASTHRLYHEAVLWSERMEMWVFFPSVVETIVKGQRDSVRLARASEPDRDVRIILASADFRTITVRKLTELNMPSQETSRGQNTTAVTKNLYYISSARFLPGSGDQVVVAVMVSRATGASYLVLITVDGEVIGTPQEFPTSEKMVFTGIEFL
eukprot:CAMPEP_0185034162 /NCGR_PEP_ID=MMETSP1103-20130426/23775_1 /TAXON_ID=36769 /ORGANISM="Paraphysomonas bandaiensis, Strain Caron Lab Isolate" /LENGTH=380 /DNA_ID=CAMNT_0027570703 /DNA_START=139 /DNA_END=1281 /DNA_ORIENTATION=+